VVAGGGTLYCIDFASGVHSTSLRKGRVTATRPRLGYDEWLILWFPYLVLVKYLRQQNNHVRPEQK